MHDVMNHLSHRLLVMLALLSMALVPASDAVAAPTAVPLGVEILSGTCTLATIPLSGSVDPITADPEQDLVAGGIYGQKKLTLKVQGCVGVGGGTLKPVVTVSGNTLADAVNVPSVTTPVLFRDDAGSEVQYAGFVLSTSPTERSWAPVNFIAAGDDIPFGGAGKSCNSDVTGDKCSEVDLYVSLACGATADCLRNFTPESNTGKLLANVTFRFAYK